MIQCSKRIKLVYNVITTRIYNEVIVISYYIVGPT